MAAPIESVGAYTMLSLLLSHSDIDPTSLAALSCTSTSYCGAVDRIWPQLMTQYARRREAKVVTMPPPALLNVKDMDDEKAEYLDECCNYYGGISISGKPHLCFPFAEFDTWGRQDALMPVHVARKKYFLGTKDLAMLPRHRTPQGRTYYPFSNVIEAAALSYGRKALLEKICTLLRRVTNKSDKMREREEVAMTLAGMERPDHFLLKRFVDQYCREFYTSGRGGVRGVADKFERHRYFSFKVKLDSLLSPLQMPVYQLVWMYHVLSVAEQERVAHLQIAYVLTGEQGLIGEAVRIVCDMQ
jgi:hypothetical protein